MRSRQRFTFVIALSSRCVSSFSMCSLLTLGAVAPLQTMLEDLGEVNLISIAFSFIYLARFSEAFIVWQLDTGLSTPLPPALMTRPEDLCTLLSLGSLALCLPRILAAFFAPRAWRLHNWTAPCSSWRCLQQLTSEPSIHLDVNLALYFVRVGEPGLLDLTNQDFLGLWTYPQTD